MDILKDISSRQVVLKSQLEEQIQRALSSNYDYESDEPAGFQGQGIYFGQQIPSMHSSEYLKSALGWVFGCVTRISDAISSVNLRLYKYDKDQVTEIDSHPALDLLERVNDFTTRNDHFSLTQQYLELAGEAPWFVSRGKEGKGEPESILLLRPDRLNIVQSKDTKSASPIEKYVYKTDDGKDHDIEITELIFLKYPDPVNYFRGKGTLAAAAKTVDIDNFSEDFNKQFFYNGARPDMVLKTEQKLSKDQRQILGSQIKKLYQGVKKSHKTLILESGLDASPFSITQKDMDFLEQQKFDMAKIFSIFGVPKSIMAVSDDVNLANAKMGEYLFAKYTIKPKMIRIVSQLNEFYLPMFSGTEQMFFSFDDPVPQDVDARTKKYDSALGKGWMTPNEVRYEENLEPVDGGDTLLVPNNFVPIDMAGQLQPTAAIGASIGKGKPVNTSKYGLQGIIERSGGGYRKAVLKSKAKAKAKEETKKNLEKIEKTIDELATSMVRGMIRQKKQQSANRRAELKTQQDLFVSAYVKSIAGFEKLFTNGMRLVFGEQLKKILKQAPEKSVKADEPKVNIDDWLLDEQDETEIMVRVFNPTIEQIIKEQGGKAMRLTGGSAGSFSLATQAVQDYLRNRTFKFSFETNEETNKLLSDTLAQGVADGESIPQLRKRVEDLFDSMEKYRAERIARSEVIRASNFAATEAYDQSGVVEGLQWVVTPDDRLCPYCEPLDGKTISLGDSFFKKGDQASGSDGSKFDLNYEDVDFPPLHPSCRCTVVPIIK